jgi:hypothetical protein
MYHHAQLDRESMLKNTHSSELVQASQYTYTQTAATTKSGDERLITALT